MAIAQAVWSLTDKKQLAISKLQNEQELENIISENIGVLNDEWIVIGRQVRTIAGGYIDLLCMDRNEDTIVVELKRDLTPREVTAQIIDYASCVAELRAEDLAQLYLDYSQGKSTLNDAYNRKFGTNIDEETINTNVKMVVVAAEMDASTERIINYLAKFHVDINILFFSVYEHAGQRYLGRAWFREESSAVTQVSEKSREWNQEFYVSFGQYKDWRQWKDALKYGFISAGGGQWYTKTLGMLNPGDRVWVNIPQIGYVGVGEVTSQPVAVIKAVIVYDGQETEFLKLKLSGKYFDPAIEEDKIEQIVQVKWLKAVPESLAVKELGFFGNQNTVCRPTSEKWEFTIRRLKEVWKIE